MRQAAICGAVTAIGVFLSTIAVYHDARFDWPETALAAGIGFLVAGIMIGARILKEIKECGEE